MVSAGYSREFATGVVTNAGTPGILIPPSIDSMTMPVITSYSIHYTKLYEGSW